MSNQANGLSPAVAANIQANVATMLANSQHQVNYFDGDYINDLRDAMVASLVAGVNGVVIGAPGFGKTRVLKSLLQTIYGDRFSFVEFHEATQPSEIQGETDYDHLMAHSQLRRNLTGTPYDPNYLAGGLDEFGRTNDAVYSRLMHLLARDGQTPVPFIGTANYMPTGKKHEALLDRFGMYHYVTTGELNAEDMAMAQMSRVETDPALKVRGRIPTVEEILKGYATRPGPNAMKAVAKFIGQLQAELRKEGWSINPRRIDVWQKVLLRMGYWITGSNDFTSLPKQATDAMKFAWSCKSETEYQQWKSILTSMVDPVQALIDNALDNAAAAVNDAAASGKDLQDKMLLYMPTLSAADKTLNDMSRQFNDDDGKIAAARKTITNWYASLSRGEKVSRS